MGEYARGSKPAGLVQQVAGEYEPKPNEVCGARITARPYIAFPPGSWNDADVANKIWSNIQAHGDEPIYVKVSTEWFLTFMTYLDVEIVFRHKGASPDIAMIILGIAAFLFALKFLLDTVYFIITPVEEYKEKKKAEAETALPSQILTAAIIMAAIAVGGYVAVNVFKGAEK